MVDENLLSQEEIEALLNRTEEEQAASDHPFYKNNDKAHSKKFIIEGDDSLKALDFEHQERIIRGQFPVLERIYDRMIRNLKEELFLLFSREIEFEQEPFSIIKYREFIAKIEYPVVINLYRFHPLRSKALFIFNAESIYEMVENYFGGHSSESKKITADEEREITVTEIRIVDVVSNRIKEKLQMSWQPIKEIKIEKVRTETSAQMINVYSPADLLVTTKFKFSFGNEYSAFYIVLPYLMIDPIREQLELGASQTDQEDDPHWFNSLKNELMDVELSVSAELASRDMRLEEVMNWKKGDFIPLEMEESVALKIENYPTFKAKVGTYNEKCALQIISRIKY